MPTLEVFKAMVIGLVGQTGQRTVCGDRTVRQFSQDFDLTAIAVSA